MKTDINVIESPKALCCPVAEIAPPGEETKKATAAFKALSDPTRMRILTTIAHMNEMCECNIVPAFGLSQPTISYHLKVLREAGLITSERRGQWVYHRVNNKSVLSTIRALAELVD